MSNHVKIRDRMRGGARSEHVSRFRKTRPKTFKTQEAAQKYAETKGLKDFKIENIREDTSGSKYRVVSD